MNITNDKVTEYLEGLYRPLNRKLKLLREVAEKHNVPIILRDSETFILNIIRMKRPERILEIGTAVGYSAICFAETFPGADIVSLEHSDEMCLYALENIKKFELSQRIQVKPGDALESLAELRDSITNVDSQGFDLVFIDAAKSCYKEFWDACIPLCRKEAVILSDNVLLKARTASDEFITDRRQKTSVRHMRKYINYITKLDYADTAVLPVGDGVAVSVLKDRQDTVKEQQL
ncbi:MAG: O-methyltransferase [Eubacteriales bacterium]|nr:O-methyltransferase [Eubacteriales bacterium]